MVNISKGLVLAIIVTIFSIYLNKVFAWSIGFEKSPVSTIIIAILIGIVISNFFAIPASFNSGFDFALKRILRIGIILLGIRLSFGDVIHLASSVLPLIIICISLTLLAAYLIAKKFLVDMKFSFLTAVGTSICGVTAIVATAPVINANKEQTSYAIANITIFGIFAMVFYPTIANLSFVSIEDIGYFLGTSIHETAQVAGAGLIYAQQFGDDKVLDIATVTKLLRNSFMLFIIPIIAFVYHKNMAHEQAKVSIARIFPYFILGFLLMALFRSFGDGYIANSGQFMFFDQADWSTLISKMKFAAEICLTIAMASVGLTTNIKSMISLGLKPLYMGLAVSSITGITSYAFIKLFY